MPIHLVSRDIARGGRPPPPQAGQPWAGHPERIKGWYTLAGGGAGFLLIEADTPRKRGEIVEPYMDLMAWDVHAVSANDYQTTVEPCDENYGNK